MEKKNFGSLEKVVPIYILNGAHVVLASDAQRLIEQLQFELLQTREVIRNYEYMLKRPLPNLKIVKDEV